MLASRYANIASSVHVNSALVLPHQASDTSQEPAAYDLREARRRRRRRLRRPLTCYVLAACRLATVASLSKPAAYDDQEVRGFHLPVVVQVEANIIRPAPQLLGNLHEITRVHVAIVV